MTVDKCFREVRELLGELGRTVVTFVALEFFPAHLPILGTHAVIPFNIKHLFMI